MRPLRLAPGLDLPVNAVTQVIGIVARRSGGKTHTAVCLVEELLDAHCQVVVIDPQGVWWGLRSSKDGKSAGYPVVVFGGKHADVPLSANMGAHVADVVADRGLSVVIDLSMLSKTAERQFVTDFLERLYKRKAAQDPPTPLHVVIDEADIFAAQRLMAGDERMFSAVDAIVRRGRTSGFGVSMITQRPAAIHKNVLSQIELLIALQITAPQDRAAVEDWIEANASSEQKREFISSLPGMEQGDAWVWSPQWLKLFKRVHIRDRKTYDSSRTPTVGDKHRGPKMLAPVDLERLRADMAAVLEETAKNDPVLLKKRIKELEGFVRAANQELDKRKVALAAKHIHPDELMKACTAVEAKISKVLKGWIKGANYDIRRALTSFLDANERSMEEGLWQAIASIHAISMAEAAAGPQKNTLAAIFPRPLTGPGAKGHPDPRPSPAGRLIVSHTASTDGAKLVRGARLMLVALAQAGKPRNAAYVGAATGLSSTSGTFGTYLGSLRSQGLIEGSGEDLSITEKGIMALGPYDPLPTGEELIEMWCRKVGGGAARILRAVAAAYPNALTAEEVGAQANISHTSGTFGTYIGKLRTLCLIERRVPFKATAELMGDG